MPAFTAEHTPDAPPLLTPEEHRATLAALPTDALQVRRGQLVALRDHALWVDTRARLNVRLAEIDAELGSR